MDRLLNILRRDVNTLLGFWIWRVVTICLLIFGGVAFIFAAIIGGLFFSVSASTIFTWFAFTLTAMLLLSLLTATIIFTVWFMHENIWILPIVIVLVLMLTVVCYTGQCYVIDCPVCGENVCFDDPSEIENLACKGECTDCINYENTYGYPHEKKCGKGFDAYCPTCGNENSFVKDSDFNHLYCNECDMKRDLDCANCGAANSIVERLDSDSLYCMECDSEFGLECSGCEEVTYLTKYSDVNNLKCEECNKKFSIECAACKSAGRNSDIATKYDLKPLRCTECDTINTNIKIADEGGFDVIKQFKLRKFIKFIDYKFSRFVEVIMKPFK